MYRTLALSFFLMLPLVALGQQVDSVRVFYLGGQSNMDGFGTNTELPESLNKTFEDVWIFHGNPAVDDKTDGGLGLWTQLSPGHGRGFSSDGLENKLSSSFGVELSFARKLRELYPDDKIALIKYSLGGTSIDMATQSVGTWDADYEGKIGINQYDHFLTTVNKAMNTTDINADGRVDYLIPSGIVWMQGESDGQNEAAGMRYYENLRKLMGLIRASFRSDTIPIVIGKISDSGDNRTGKVWKYGELVQYGQEKFVMTDPNAAIVRDTKHYQYSDAAHYNSQGYIDLGEKFAKALQKLSLGEEKLPSLAAHSVITLKNGPDKRYRAKGKQSLVDEKVGSKYFDDGYWLGFEEEDFSATIDLGKEQEIDKVTIGVLQDAGAWIFFPEYVEVSWSADGKKYSRPIRIKLGADQKVRRQLERVTVEREGLKTRFIKVFIKNTGKCPQWHYAAGGKAWLFVDEITVQ
ncbi:MAG: sialate O-acetylesterase [Roseivirga sp.]|nr:sialate O-acetylesterase [Roseivirga sp.]